MLMTTLSYFPLSTENFQQLGYWRELRRFYVGFVMPVNYGEAQWGFLSFLITCVLTLASVVFFVFDEGIRVLTFLGPQVAICIFVLTSGVSFLLMTSAVSIWYSQVKHISMLQDLKFDVRRYVGVYTFLCVQFPCVFSSLENVLVIHNNF